MYVVVGEIVIILGIACCNSHSSYCNISYMLIVAGDVAMFYRQTSEKRGKANKILYAANS